MAETDEKTEVGSVFVSNYPPFSVWSGRHVDAAREVLTQPYDPATPFGLYLHIPFCRKRCKFCYFRVYTDKDGKSVRRYLDALAREVELYAGLPSVQGRPLSFVYFGGGTPSFISVRQLQALVTRVTAALPWDGVEEVTFECEPGTLSLAKLKAIRDLGITRLSLGVENFNDAILAENGRAHLSAEIEKVLPWIEKLDFPQLNIDLIAGMVGETWDTWKDTVQRTVDIAPDSVTVYQMELPYNTVYSQTVLEDGSKVPVAGWPQKRAWHDHAFERLEAAGYEVSSAYTVVRKGSAARFAYRDRIWHGADMVGTGVASFSHFKGFHFQNTAGWDPYLDRIEAGELPLERAYATTPEDRLIREFILQLKLGRIPTAYFQEKFGVDVLSRFAPALAQLEEEGMLEVGDAEVVLAREGLLRVDQLLPTFYADVYRHARYT